MVELATAQQRPTAGFTPDGLDFPRARDATDQEVHDLLVANRFAEALEAARCCWPVGHRLRNMIEVGLYQTAVCHLVAKLYPASLASQRAAYEQRRLLRHARAL